MKVNNAIILAAGTASRFAPLSYEKPKALIEVRGEILIERQIKQLRKSGVEEIVVVTGYKADQFEYLENKYHVRLVHNPDYLSRNNHASIYAARNDLKNSYICSSDNYFVDNPFEEEVEESYYSSIYVTGKTDEWCITEENGWIKDVKVGGHDSWIMLGHVFWSEAFSKKYLTILEQEYCKEGTKDKLWEKIYIEHIDELPMKVRRYQPGSIFEFDTLDELRAFDETYIEDTHSKILKTIAKRLNVNERDITQVQVMKDRKNMATGFTFLTDRSKKYKYNYKTEKVEVITQ